MQGEMIGKYLVDNYNYKIERLDYYGEIYRYYYCCCYYYTCVRTCDPFNGKR